VPRAGRAHDLIYSSGLRSPSQFIARFRCVADESRGIARSSIAKHDRDSQAGHTLDGGDDFLDRLSTAIAEIVNRGLASVQERPERFDVGLRQV
jgi:hypothetical protein